jgi:hypothetical protein
MLSWGRNFMFLTELFLEYFPGYNKFRTVSMTLVMAELAIPLLAILAVNKMITGEYKKKELLNALKFSVIIVGGITLIFALFPGISDLSSEKDKLLIEQGARDLVNVMREDRADLVRSDSFRSLIFVLLAAALVYIFATKKIKPFTLYAALGLLILFDLWPVNKRYLNDENFVSKRLVEEPFRMTPADARILEDQDIYFRVYDLSAGNPIHSTRASYFHKSIGGYHGAKMRRFQEVYDRHIKNEFDEEVLDMFNTKYIIQRNPQNNQTVAIRRPSHLGNAWFVPEYQLVEDADEEIDLLDDFDPAQTALIDKRFDTYVKSMEPGHDSLAFIDLVDYSPNRLEYKYATDAAQVAVFSEMYYPEGWEVYINGNEVEHFRVNYLLRGLVVPEGEGTIVFEFRPDSYFVGKKVAFAGSVLMVLMVLGAIYYQVRVRRKKEDSPGEQEVKNVKS